ncbi:peptidase inhibitor family I36 protein [Streptomyces globisporus]|uniref:peptidase inhibitor family I36 protein n=1 Tax=Streptomyces globisporus TaxID=1908 RepID=UPI0038118E19
MKKRSVLTGFALGAVLLTAGGIAVATGISDKAATASGTEVSAKAGVPGGLTCVYKDLSFNGSFSSSMQKFCFRESRSMTHVGSMRQNVDDAISSIVNRGTRTVCFYVDPDHRGAALEVNPGTSVRLTGIYERYNDRLTSFKSC